ncbi:DNA repair and recombination protein [Planoprotostelium fungivorum]|uniref:ATP-dependent DNA helicase n=1 Tax=Planoprotostelium fungivorum TaxID=1890364 RepID=A0A2P6P0D8_9EUKA|nr:DNA repair and recombination protein [Planoprotostelium fungivorum]
MTIRKECEQQTKDFPGARYKTFESLKDAQQFMSGGTPTPKPVVNSTPRQPTTPIYVPPKQTTAPIVRQTQSVTAVPVKPSNPITPQKTTTVIPQRSAMISLTENKAASSSLRDVVKMENKAREQKEQKRKMMSVDQMLRNSSVPADKKPTRKLPSTFGRQPATTELTNKTKAYNPTMLRRAKPSWDDLTPMSEEQNEIYQAILSGQNIFFTGSAGTGKTFLLRKIRNGLEQRGKKVAVTAPTGIAAVNVGGVTIHRWSGIGVSPSVDVQSKAAWRNKQLWRDTDVLIIDEISMVSGRLFDLLEGLGQKIRGVSSPFGGIQLVLCGDFLQLPPVNDSFNPIVDFCFEAKSWHSCVHISRELQMLNDIRLGRCTDSTRQTLDELKDKHRERQIHRAEGSVQEKIVYPTMLHCTNMKVDEMNSGRLSELAGDTFTYDALDLVLQDPNNLVPSKTLSSLLDALPISAVVHLKLNAQVMLLCNLDDHLINGSRGVVIDFERISDANVETLAKEKDIPIEWLRRHPKLPVIQFDNGTTKIVTPEIREVIGVNGGASRCQIPLRLAWSLTVHKSQGLSLDKAIVSLSNVFEPGQAYVALSRLRSLEGLEVADWKPQCIRANPKVIAFYEKIFEKEKEEPSAKRMKVETHTQIKSSITSNTQIKSDITSNIQIKSETRTQIKSQMTSQTNSDEPDMSWMECEIE